MVRFCLYVCLSVCVSACKISQTVMSDVDEISWRTAGAEEPVRFQWRSVPESESSVPGSVSRSGTRNLYRILYSLLRFLQTGKNKTRQSSVEGLNSLSVLLFLFFLSSSSSSCFNSITQRGYDFFAGCSSLTTRSPESQHREAVAARDNVRLCRHTR